MVNPLPVELIKTFAEKVEKVYVIEELDDVIESHCKKRSAWTSLARSCSPLCGEFNQSLVRRLLTGEELPAQALEAEIPVRPPVMCCGCPTGACSTPRSGPRFMCPAISAAIP